MDRMERSCPTSMRLLERVPRLTFTNILLSCLLLSLVIFVGVTNRIGIFVYPMNLADKEQPGTSPFLTPSTTPPELLEFSFRVAAPGETIHVEDMHVQIATVVHSDDYPARSGFNIFMNGWVRHKTPTGFQCCLLRSLPNGTLVDDVLTQVRAYTYHIYEQWIVDRQNAEFSCSVSRAQMAGMGGANFTHVTFAKESCLNAPVLVLPIIRPQPVPNSVCVCLKITYGSLKPESVIEWFEYTRHMGVTKVFTYYAEVSPQALKVLKYYQSIGFLEMIPIQPAVSKDGEKRRFTRPRFEQQAWVDEVMAANDCKHRMAKYNYVIVMDIDEFLVPKGGFTSYLDILQAASQQHPSACAFSLDVHVAMLDWGPTRSSPINICRYTNRTMKANYDGADRNTRWAFLPPRTYWVQNNLAHCRKGYQVVPVPSDMYIILHYRSCKPEWVGCAETPRLIDPSMLKYELPLVDRILSLPLTELLQEYDTYVHSLTDWRDNNIIHRTDNSRLLAANL